MIDSPKTTIGSRKTLAIATIGLLALGIVAYFVLPNPVDWTISYRPATLALLSGRSPYTELPFFNPPWILLPLIPFAILTYRLGVSAFFVTNLVVFYYISQRMAARSIARIALFCSFPVIVCLLFGQIDGLVLLGLFMPRPLGLILLLAKPQMGAAIAVFWLVEAWRAGRWKQVATTIAPVAVLFLISLALYGLWPLQLDMKDMFVATFNTSLWPGSLMIGLPLLVHALRHRKESFALMAAPFFSPYVTPQSWSVALVGLMPYELEMVAASLASWALLIIKIAASH